jgi:diguanylate cyclase (GGDEF)-like protein
MPAHWTVLSNYRLRTGSFAIMFASILLLGWERSFGTALWVWLTAHLLLYPHLAFWRATRSAQSERAEGQNLLFDSLLFGVSMALLGFPLWIAFTVYLASTLNNTISYGPRGWLASQLAYLAGAVLAALVFGWRLFPETGWPATLLCVLGNTVYMSSIGLTAFRRNHQLRQTREALRLSEQTLTQQIAEVQALQAQLQDQATHDPLTGLYNRRFLDTIAAREIARCHRENHPLVVMMIDIDHFKSVNDTYGHSGGDEVLKSLAALLQKSVRAADVPCRFGGEEFLLLLPGMPPEVAQVRAEQWRAAFADLVVQVDGVPVQATLSAGLAFYPDDGNTLAQLTHCADLALYRAKAEGRNRVVSYRSEWANDPSEVQSKKISKLAEREAQ